MIINHMLLPTNMLAFSGVSKLAMSCTFLWMNREHALFIYNRSASDITKLYPAFLFAAIGWLNPNPIHVGFHIPILCVEVRRVQGGASQGNYEYSDIYHTPNRDCRYKPT